MERFKKDISVNNEPRAFEFNKMKNMNVVKFFITSTDAKQKPIADEGKWKLFRGSLRWLYEIESELSDAILQMQAGK